MQVSICKFHLIYFASFIFVSFIFASFILQVSFLQISFLQVSFLQGLFCKFHFPKFIFANFIFISFIFACFMLARFILHFSFTMCQNMSKYINICQNHAKSSNKNEKARTIFFSTFKQDNKKSFLGPLRKLAVKKAWNVKRIKVEFRFQRFSFNTWCYGWILVAY